MTDIKIYDDCGAITLVPADGGEVWVEPAEDGFQIGAEEASSRYPLPGIGYVQLTPDELRAFRKIIDDAVEKAGV